MPVEQAIPPWGRVVRRRARGRRRLPVASGAALGAAAPGCACVQHRRCSTGGGGGPHPPLPRGPAPTSALILSTFSLAAAGAAGAASGGALEGLPKDCMRSLIRCTCWVSCRRAGGGGGGGLTAMRTRIDELRAGQCAPSCRQPGAPPACWRFGHLFHSVLQALRVQGLHGFLRAVARSGARPAFLPSWCGLRTSGPHLQLLELIRQIRLAGRGGRHGVVDQRTDRGARACWCTATVIECGIAPAPRRGGPTNGGIQPPVLPPPRCTRRVPVTSCHGCVSEPAATDGHSARRPTDVTTWRTPCPSWTSSACTTSSASCPPAGMWRRSAWRARRSCRLRVPTPCGPGTCSRPSTWFSR